MLKFLTRLEIESIIVSQTHLKEWSWENVATEKIFHLTNIMHTEER